MKKTSTNRKKQIMIIDYISDKIQFNTFDNTFCTSLLMRYPDDTCLKFAYVSLKKKDYFSDRGKTYQFIKNKLSKYEKLKDELNIKRFVDSVAFEINAKIDREEILVDISSCESEKDLNEKLGVLISHIDFFCQRTNEYVKEKCGDENEDLWDEIKPISFDEDWDELFGSIWKDEEDGDKESSEKTPKNRLRKKIKPKKTLKKSKQTIIFII